MPAAPANPTSNGTRKASRYIVLLGPPDGSRPTLDDEVEHLLPISIRRSSGGKRLDIIELEVDLEKWGGRLENTTTVIGTNVIVEVRKLEDDGSADQIVGWGKYAKQRQVLDQANETVTVIVRIDPFLFDGPLQFYYEHDPISGQAIPIHQDIIFNPEIDEKVEPNREQVFRLNNGSAVFLSPESNRTAAAVLIQGGFGAGSWTLPEAVFTLCWLLNGSETYITNPTVVDLNVAFANANNALLRNIKIPLGSDLPKALDLLLEPFGFSWFIESSVDNSVDPPVTISEFRFFQRGVGNLVDVYSQATGEVINNIDTNVAKLNAAYSYVDLANRVKGFSDTILREGTFDLHIGWPDSHDSEDLFNLPVSTTVPKEVGRKFVLNEGGDWTLLRPEITAHTSLATLLGPNTRIMRRKFEKCISVDANNESNGIVVEWENPDAEGGPAWEKVKWGYSVLKKECGIFFEGKTAPAELWRLLQDDPDTVKLRVTAAIKGDSRTWGDATRQPTSPNGLDVTLTLDLSRKFADRRVEAIGPQTSQFIGGPADVEDPTAAIQTYCESVRDAEDAAEVSCSIVLEGIDNPEYEIGKLIRKLEGRNLVFDANAPLVGEPRRPQIVGINYFFDNRQETELVLESFKEEQP